MNEALDFDQWMRSVQVGMEQYLSTFLPDEKSVPARLHEGMRRLGLNVNEAILLRDLIWSLPSPSADAALQFVLSENSE